MHSYEYFSKIIKPTRKVFSDQMGRFSITSSKRNKYIMVVYDYDSNTILVEPLKSKSATNHLTAIIKMYKFLQSRGIQPKICIIDNKCSKLVNYYIKNSLNLQLQLVPPHMHQVNIAEKAIDIYKNHFISGLAIVNPSFPLHLWCRIVPLATTTLNLLRPTRINPRLSVNEFLNGVFDYNKTPLAPLGTKVLVYDALSNRKT